MNTQTSNTHHKTAQVIDDIKFILSILIFTVSFRTIKTRVLKEHAREYQKKWEKQKQEMQRLLDEEHATGQGVMFIDGRTKFYDPYTLATLRK